MQAREGWKWFKQRLESNIAAWRQIDARVQVTGQDAAFELANARGVLEGLRIALAIPIAAVQDIQHDVDVVKAELAVDEEETEHGDDGRT